ncbi:hypothetical protein KIW84_040213 [Lathyrus oleraceus]|uniref:Uncharacterized protein n=1 Tax=Pisum sativum TaxID=3888 RepID=A0A9D4X6G6_PEA|nr:hypothetical protein KIW84_040213 [Pisum sativum]
MAVDGIPYGYSLKGLKFSNPGGLGIEIVGVSATPDIIGIVVELCKAMDPDVDKPHNWNKKKSDSAFQASNSYQGQQPPPSRFPLTTEQLDRLYKLLESSTPSYSIATKGNSAFLSVSLSHTWIVDSGVSDHMTGESTLFSSYSPCAGFELGEDDWQC